MFETLVGLMTVLSLSLPVHIYEKVDSEYEVIVTKTISSYVERKLNDVSEPYGFIKDCGYKNAGGIHIRDTRKILVAKYVVLGCQSDKYVLNKNIEKDLFHEFGHAVNYSFGWLANGEEFYNAYSIDVSRLSDKDKMDISYYLQQGSRGLTETFAEVFAELFGYGHGKDLISKFPSVVSLMKQQLNI